MLPEDIAELQKVLNRAVTKQQKLASLIAATNLPRLRYEDAR